MTEESVKRLRVVAEATISMENHFINMFNIIGATPPKELIESSFINDKLLEESKKEIPSLSKIILYKKELEQMQDSAGFKIIIEE